jgi:DNA-binding transcriptional LysR family regulator
VRESDTRRATRVLLDAAQRWTVSHVATSVKAASLAYGYGWYPEERIRDELAAGTLQRLPLAEGGERYAELYLVFGDRENAGPGVLRLAELLRERVQLCPRDDDATPRRRRGGAVAKTAPARRRAQRGR